jgi:hypothetical protein
VIYSPVILSKLKSMKPNGPISSAPVCTGDLSPEIIRKRPSLREIGGLPRAPRLTQETKPAGSLSEKKFTAPKAPTEGFKGGRPSNFDVDDAIQWVGRTI